MRLCTSLTLPYCLALPCVKIKKQTRRRGVIAESESPLHVCMNMAEMQMSPATVMRSTVSKSVGSQNRLLTTHQRSPAEDPTRAGESQL